MTNEFKEITLYKSSRFYRGLVLFSCIFVTAFFLLSFGTFIWWTVDKSEAAISTTIKLMACIPLELFIHGAIRAYLLRRDK